MKIRTAEQLYDFTTQELAWRKKELFSLHALLFTSGISPNKKNALLRSSVALIYAHWEGFIKSCSTAYVEYVAMQRLKHNELAMNFLALAIRPLLMNAFQSRKADDHIKVVSFFMSELAAQSSMQYKDVINTQSNLNTAVLRNIISSLGLDYSLYATKEKLLDERLLRTRNQIAHGEYVELTDKEVQDIQAECITLMETFKNQIDNAVTLRTYRIST
jgi:hypothetical protein